jgi:tetratricopeptide (TPR) repeat protein
MLLFLPLARYKIALTPLFAILAAWWIVYIFHLIRSPRKQPLVVPLILYFSSFLVSGYICRNRIDRECDLKAYGIAASYLPDKLMSQGRYHQALKILEKYYMVNKKNPYIMLNYASSLMGTGQASKAGEVLFNCHYIQDQSLLGRYFYELGECAYMKCNFKGALKYYNTALQYPISERREEFAKARIRSISERDK